MSGGRVLCLSLYVLVYFRQRFDTFPTRRDAVVRCACGCLSSLGVVLGFVAVAALLAVASVWLVTFDGESFPVRLVCVLFLTCGGTERRREASVVDRAFSPRVARSLCKLSPGFAPLYGGYGYFMRLFLHMYAASRRPWLLEHLEFGDYVLQYRGGA